MKHYDLEINNEKRRDAMKKEEFLTARWNNVLTVGLGLVFVVYAVVVWSTSVLSDTAAFIGLVIIGAVY